MPYTGTGGALECGNIFVGQFQVAARRRADDHEHDLPALFL